MTDPTDDVVVGDEPDPGRYSGHVKSVAEVDEWLPKVLALRNAT